jgi:hypothetical protein
MLDPKSAQLRIFVRKFNQNKYDDEMGKPD